MVKYDGVEERCLSYDSCRFGCSITAESSCRSTGYKRTRPQIKHFPGKMATSGVSRVVRQAFNKFAHPQRCHVLIKKAQVSSFQLTLI